MKKLIGFTLICAMLLTVAGCGGNKNQENSDPAQPSYNAEATESDEGVQTTEDGSLIVPSYSEGYGNSNGRIIHGCSQMKPQVEGNGLSLRISWMASA